MSNSGGLRKRGIATPKRASAGLGGPPSAKAKRRAASSDEDVDEEDDGGDVVGMADSAPNADDWAGKVAESFIVPEPDGAMPRQGLGAAAKRKSEKMEGGGDGLKALIRQVRKKCEYERNRL